MKKEMWSTNTSVFYQEKVKIWGEVALQSSFIAIFDREDNSEVHIPNYPVWQVFYGAS